MSNKSRMNVSVVCVILITLWFFLSLADVISTETQIALTGATMVAQLIIYSPPTWLANPFKENVDG
jgi:hypothetical protein